MQRPTKDNFGQNTLCEKIMFAYEQAKAHLIQRLAQDADLHVAGQFSRIGENFEEFDANLPRGAGPEFDKLHVALNFWDSWQDSRNHEWKYYPKITQDDWPRLARSIITDISADRDVQDDLITGQFDFRRNHNGTHNQSALRTR